MAGVQITTGGRERVPEAAKLLSDAFETNPTVTYILSSLTPEQRNAYRPKSFWGLLTSAALDGAIFDEANGWKSCGVLMPPGTEVGRWRTLIPSGFISLMRTIGLGGCYRMMYEVPARSNPCKKKALKGEKRYYYVLFLGTSKEGRGQGLCSAIVKQYQEIARKEKLPIYMEAGTEYAWGLYKSLGFITVDEMITGKGKAAADGTQLKGGPGFKGWSMIWRPE